MKTMNIFKDLSLIALSCFALAGGSAQAQGWGGRNPYLPAIEPAAPYHDDLGDHFDHDSSQRRDDRASIDSRQRAQIERIRNGFENGQISRHEARDLMWEQKEIEMKQRRYLADGYLSRDEWISLERMLDQAAAHIRAEKHDWNWR